MTAVIGVETTSLSPNAGIVCLYGVKFSYNSGIHSTFESFVNIESLSSLGFDIDDKTINFHKSKNGPQVFSGKDHLTDVLRKFSLWAFDITNLWMNYPIFHHRIIENAYERIDGRVPWGFYKIRCYNTMKEILRPDDIYDTVNQSIKYFGLRKAVVQSQIITKLAHKHKLLT